MRHLSVSINSGGEKIFPEEVEMALKAHPNIFDCLVVGVKDDRWGQKVVAVIQRRENDELSLDDIKDVASKYIASLLYILMQHLLYHLVIVHHSLFFESQQQLFDPTYHL